MRRLTSRPDFAGQAPFIYRLGPELVMAGIVRNEPWVERAGLEAEAMFTERNLKIAGVILAVAHRHGLDYLRQAPVLALAAAMPHAESSGRLSMEVAIRRRTLGKQLAYVLSDGPRLKPLLASFGLLPQHREIKGDALLPEHWDVIWRLAEIAPSTLAQCIPTDGVEQRFWLSDLGMWRRAMLRHRGDASHLFGWAVRFLSQANLDDVAEGQLQSVNSVADFAGAHGTRFNEAWDYRRAARGAEGWHRQLAILDRSEGFFARHGYAWDQPIDYGSLPTDVHIDGLDIVALRSGLALFEEGKAMHHCVASYDDAVVAGRARIFSFRRAGKRLATMEIAPGEATGWRRVQLKGPCNAEPAGDVRAAARAFLRHINADARRTAA